jgi:hypothetical protein
MSRIVQARLDEDTESMLAKLEKQLECSSSEIVRRGIKALAAMMPPTKKRKFRGIGKYDSGLPDLASNPKHMEGFGK